MSHELALSNTLKLGLIINPFAGIGGKVGLKGSDGEQIREQAFALGAIQQAENRARITLEALLPFKEQIHWYCASSAMGETLLQELGFTFELVYQAPQLSSDRDTIETVERFNTLDLDLLVFAGGDGTARNICSVIDETTPVLGVPAGVKIHSGVYAITPLAAAEVLRNILTNQLVSLIEASVMDIDEEAFRAGTVTAKKHGQLLVPAEHQYIQATKVSSAQLNREDEALVQKDIAEFVVEDMDDELHYLIGTGTSCAAVMDALDLPGSLLGIDWVYQNQLMGSDLNEADILQLLEQQAGKVRIILTAIGGQGHIIGRGNHQFSATVLARLNKSDLIIIATKTKLKQLNSKPLLIDSDLPAINNKFAGIYRVICGYDDEVLYQLGAEF
ncbi:ATP-NAD kinase family protein [Kangiella sp. TOML190]|uniref:ATP-NAD kinase family protein n=1 Tax=Kangiella sp. TOML190 TaxID=2931351 RepID=UPI00203B28E4|nr:ATP-NAD kinase family protein [Kangiella sp. TOML190]